MTFADLSPEFFQLSPAPRGWYERTHADLEALGRDTERRDVIEALANYLDSNATENLLLVDSLTDLVGIREEGVLGWNGIVSLVKGLRRAAREWGGVILFPSTRRRSPSDDSAT